MKVVFWGNEEEAKITANMVILASFLAYHKGFRITMAEELPRENGILNYFPKPNRYYHEDYIETLAEKQLYYVSLQKWKQCRKKKMTLTKLLAYLDYNMDFIFMNLGNRKDEEARQIMWEADLFVVTVKQNKQTFEAFFAKNGILSENQIFLISDYYDDGDCNQTYLQKKYQMSEEQLAVLPLNPEFQYIKGKNLVERYIRRNKPYQMSGMKHYFMKEVEKTAQMIVEVKYIIQ